MIGGVDVFDVSRAPQQQQQQETRCRRFQLGATLPKQTLCLFSILGSRWSARLKVFLFCYLLNSVTFFFFFQVSLTSLSLSPPIGRRLSIPAPGGLSAAWWTRTRPS